MKEKLLVLAVLAIILTGCRTIARSPGEPQPPGRLSVAVLWFANRTGDPESEHWRSTLDWLLDEELRAVKRIKLVRSETIERARKSMDLEKGAALEGTTARRLGEIIEAQRVVWGFYRHDGDRWVAVARVQNVAAGTTSPEILVSSPDWLEVRDGLVAAILGHLGVAPSREEQARMGRRLTKAAESLESFSRGYAIYRDGGSFAESEAFLRKAISADPEFARARVGLGAVLVSQGKFAEAAEAIGEGIRRAPDDPRARQVQGVCFILQGHLEAAEKALRESVDFDPEDPGPHIRLGELFKMKGSLDLAVESFQRALRLAPFLAHAHSGLGHVYALKGDPELALAAAREAERLDPDDAGTLQMLALTFDALDETALAVQNYERFVELARKRSGNPTVVARLEERGKELKARLEPARFEVPMPRVYSGGDLDGALRQKLAPDEIAKVVNPLADTPPMRHWAVELARGVDGELEKARVLFDALARRSDPRDIRGTRTAREVFDAWKDPEESFTCQEYAKLYVALARSVGLQAFFVHLEKDYSGKPVFHDCAAVFIEGKAILVDPAYRWFGIPHREFQVLDDVQAIAHQLFQSSEGDPAANCRIAAKLHPGFAWGLLILASALGDAGDHEEAWNALHEAVHLDPDRWYVLRARGFFALQDGREEEAKTLFERAISKNPDDSGTSFGLAKILESEGNLIEARELYRRVPGPHAIPQMEEEARRKIAEINEKIGSE